MIGIVILAAGASARMGEPKQELLYKGETLLQHAVNAALATNCQPVIVVLGANTNLYMPEEASKSVATVHNPDWQEGMSSSIRCGLSALLTAAPHTEGVILMVCDQPFVKASLLNSLIHTKESSGKGIVACQYKDTLGTPVLFSKDYFDELLYLRGKEGAKKLLFRHNEDVADMPFALGAIDIDTPEDYALLRRTESKG
ncbi:nucleotidyltransferase family protein [Pontibacter russatus]|uniref:nucleotidyltransferase family protein n=1 Tax=Pontibacter russatus TaxID=2694929 RepID=UPI00137A975F|nr:nucleotidyltransferase family protein [Pontibacter russatus]